MGDVGAVNITTQQIVKQVAPPSGMYYGVSLDVAPSGNMFVAWVDFTPANNNVTWVQVRKYAPNNSTVLGEWRITPTATFKIDNLSISHRGANLLVAMGTHTSVAGPARTRAVELATIPNVYS